MYATRAGSGVPYLWLRQRAGISLDDAVAARLRPIALDRDEKPDEDDSGKRHHDKAHDS